MLYPLLRYVTSARRKATKRSFCYYMRKINRKTGYHEIRAYKRRKEQEKRAVIDGCVGREGYVYIFKVGEGLYKIGMTTNIKNRLKALEASCPNILCIWSAKVRDRYFAEKDLHNFFKKKKNKREIYILNMPDDMLQADQTVNKYRQ